MAASIAALAGAAVAAATPVNASPSRTASVSGSASTDPGPALSSFNVISDVQGDLGDFGRALDDMSSTNPRSTGLVVNGDITPRGYDFEYAAVRKTLDEHPHEIGRAHV